ncbi:MarR family winged helix-turn-helix transcriptional regulator [Paratractidigestivibacter faecalis]|uniref:MarR family winged helix-turn-helix transcriptional regulator n=1 Tax=Paratractidigestivibacter faecalis TaxID=2292441 RepID=UPI003A8DE231
MQEESRFEDFVGLIGAIDKEIQRIKTAELARFGLRASDLMVVYYLEKNPEGLTGADLARLADVDRAAVSRTVTRLAADGFVEVGEESTRYRAPIHLTEKGYAAMAEVNGLISQIVRQAGGGLMDEQRRALYASLESVLGQLRVIAR